MLAAIIFILYVPSLFGGFVLDDHRCLRLLGEYHRGERQSLDVYRFLFGGQANREAREAGWYAWWLGDDVRYRHLRPAAEWALYGEYLLFGDRAIGFRLVGLGLYMLGVRLVLALFRLIGSDEALARWAALLFAVAACHAVPVVFVSNHCDLIALAFGAGSMLAAGCFVRDGGAAKLLGAVVLFAVGLFSKEAVLPMAILPACFWLVFRGRAGAGRRAWSAIIALAACGLAWLTCYILSDSGSNAVLMLDPIHAPLEYLAALPGRAIVLLSTWIIPFNPFLFLLRHEWSRGLYTYGAVGACCLLLLAAMYWRHHRRQQGIVPMALWALPFLPLLACTVPDDRVMMLPSIGLAFLGAAWMTRPRADGSRRLRVVPLALFVVLQLLTVLAAMGLVQFMESEAQEHLKVMLAGLGRPARAGDHLFCLNGARNFQTLFAQDRLLRLSNIGDLRASMLSDIPGPRVRVVDDHTIRLEAEQSPFFSSFAGQMGTSRTTSRRVGDTFSAGEFEGRIAEVRDGQVWAVELRFHQPITSDSYRFYWSDAIGPPLLFDVRSQEYRSVSAK